MFSFLKRLWPFISKKEHERVVALQFQQILEQKRLTRKAEDQQTRFQTAFADLMRQKYTQWRDLGLKAIKLVEDMAYVNIACHSPIIASVVDEPIDIQSRIKHKQIQMLQFGFKMGLSEEIPPELIAKEIALRVERAILEQWRDQSILLKV